MIHYAISRKLGPPGRWRHGLRRTGLPTGRNKESRGITASLNLVWALFLFLRGGILPSPVGGTWSEAQGRCNSKVAFYKLSHCGKRPRIRLAL